MLKNPQFKGKEDSLAYYFIEIRKSSLTKYNVPHVVDTHMQIIYQKFWLPPILETQIFILIPKLCNHMWLNQF